MIKQLNAVKEFHTAFEIGYSESPKSDLGESKNMLRNEADSLGAILKIN